MRERLIELLESGMRVHGHLEYLADYLLVNGVIVPPCKVGDTVYMIVERRAKITMPYYSFIKKTELTYCNMDRVIKDFGKTVFLTKEEAEQALKERFH